MIKFILIISLISGSICGGPRPGRPGPPGPRPGCDKTGINPHAKTSASSYVLNNLYYVGLNQTLKLMKDPINAGKKILDVARTVRFPPELCSVFSKPACDPNYKYQSFDGSCNNLNKPWLGKTDTPYKRHLQPEYSDNLSAPRSIAQSKNALPNTRVISRALSSDNSQFENSWTHLGALFGQFLTHDFSAHGDISDSKGNEFECPCGTTSAFCDNVAMPSDETIMKQSCMQFTRSSASFPTYDCRMDYREQVNLMSSFIDASQVYGENLNTSLNLRLKTGGLMRSSNGVTARPYLPKSDDATCSATDPTMMCFIAGESRTSENLGLAGIQLLFMREHNRIATELAKINVNWNDDQLYFETRRIVVAMYQHIVYNEWLASVLGKTVQQQSGLLPLKVGPFIGYDPRVNPSVFNEFTTVAMRFGHSLVRNQLSRFTDENGVVVALDLAAYNIQRGRDHGIPAYVKYRSLCGFRQAITFQDLSDTVSSEKIALLQTVYENVADIDLWVGGLAETPRPDSLIGPTFSCMIAKQFQDFKRSDRFFYENAKDQMLGTQLTAFTLEQLNEIRKVSMASLICKDFDIVSIQPNVFLKASAAILNDRILCSSMAKIDLSKWRQF